METDRTAVLMVQAASRGAVDFTKANRRDRWWWQRTRWILEDLEREAHYRALSAQHQHWITSFANAALDETAFKTTQNNAKQALGSLLSTILPWSKVDFDDVGSAGTIEEALDNFREEYGYPGDPRYEKMIEESSAALQSIIDENPAA